jgi:hypothetical protein
MGYKEQISSPNAAFFQICDVLTYLERIINALQYHLYKFCEGERNTTCPTLLIHNAISFSWDSLDFSTSCRLPRLSGNRHKLISKPKQTIQETETSVCLPHSDNVVWRRRNVPICSRDCCPSGKTEAKSWKTCHMPSQTVSSTETCAALAWSATWRESSKKTSS